MRMSWMALAVRVVVFGGLDLIEAAAIVSGDGAARFKEEPSVTLADIGTAMFFASKLL